MKNVYENPELVGKKCPHIKEMVDFINSIPEEIELQFITGSSESLKKQTEEFLDTHIKRKREETIYVHGMESKMKFVSESDCFLIDDYPYYTRHPLFDKNKSILMNAPWNFDERDDYKYVIYYDNKRKEMIVINNETLEIIKLEDLIMEK
jgi:hypothetical protein